MIELGFSEYVSLVDRPAVTAREVVAIVIGVVAGRVPRQGIIPAVTMPVVDTAPRIAARPVRRCVIEPEIDVGLRHRRQCARRRIVEIEVVVVVIAAGRDIGGKHEADIGRRGIAVQHMARQVLPGQSVVIGDAQVAAVRLHLAGGDQGSRVERRDARGVTVEALIRRVCAGRDSDLVALQVSAVPPQRRRGE